MLRRLGHRVEEVGVISRKICLFTEEIRTKIQRRQLPVRAPFNVFNVLKQEDNSPTGIGYKVGPRLRELAPRGQREPGGGIHAT